VPEQKALPVVVVALPVWQPVMDSVLRRVAEWAVEKLDINTSTVSEPLRRVLKQVEVVVVAFGSWAYSQPAI